MRDLSKILDGDLLEMLKNDDDAFAFSELYNRYWDKLFGAAYKRIRSVETAEEIIQDLFTDIWARRKKLDIQAELPVYLFCAVRYRVINHIDKKMVKISFEKVRPLLYPLTDNSTEEIVIANDLRYCLEQEAQLLPVKCREVYYLSRHEHQSNKSIAKQLSISEKTVENQITKALKRLRTSLNNFLF
jgi:RNA polymerase sigma-70 factor (family 1)